MSTAWLILKRLIDLTLSKESKDYLDKIKIEDIIRRYSDHISIPIFVTDGSEKKDDTLEPVNSASAIWTRAKNKITKDKQILNYCGGGIAASLEAFVLYQLGFEKIVIYDNSLHEWAAIDQTLPMENN